MHDNKQIQMDNRSQVFLNILKSLQYNECSAVEQVLKGFAGRKGAGFTSIGALAKMTLLRALTHLIELCMSLADDEEFNGYTQPRATTQRLTISLSPRSPHRRRTTNLFRRPTTPPLLLSSELPSSSSSSSSSSLSYSLTGSFDGSEFVLSELFPKKVLFEILTDCFRETAPEDIHKKNPQVEKRLHELKERKISIVKEQNMQLDRDILMLEEEKQELYQHEDSIKELMKQVEENENLVKSIEEVIEKCAEQMKGMENGMEKLAPVRKEMEDALKKFTEECYSLENAIKQQPFSTMEISLMKQEIERLHKAMSEEISKQNESELRVSAKIQQRDALKQEVEKAIEDIQPIIQMIEEEQSEPIDKTQIMISHSDIEKALSPLTAASSASSTEYLTSSLADSDSDSIPFFHKKIEAFNRLINGLTLTMEQSIGPLKQRISEEQAAENKAQHHLNKRRMLYEKQKEEVRSKEEKFLKIKQMDDEEVAKLKRAMEKKAVDVASMRAEQQEEQRQLSEEQVSLQNELDNMTKQMHLTRQQKSQEHILLIQQCMSAKAAIEAKMTQAIEALKEQKEKREETVEFCERAAKAFRDEAIKARKEECKSEEENKGSENSIERVDEEIVVK
ncbi:uncharacterized protein MONOS_1225 [Monocercomonoides exilis]|uniref:uncharacterized protein n=1 Tax=Monocercomonoides exilis TaxID=2049356 RepID=UPI00355AAE87|nr:hypothetical protein MONOS_1225 [Monocercomonoides exilis]|eukprot:MONOS_1225.1-p1 / transcript=MONOS_1225.1 / gene=MONOS_1225 / organism=Monocercomonoides_exilis_PA203 / gene_product=unspecified product / transcript_product=unspecified product / location=Mono_scaffold00021:23937-26433(-) / protein_length=621 / sequence_SO=supercontig / SO=protein_coding / is_pseudo=false